MNKNQFTTWDVIKFLEINRERLREWLQRGYIAPSIQKAQGVGTKNIFSRWDMYMIALFDRLVSNGFSRELAERTVKFMLGEKALQVYKEKGADLADLGASRFIIFRRSYSYPDKEPTVTPVVLLGKPTNLRLDSGFDDMFIVNFERIRKFVDKRIQ